VCSHVQQLLGLLVMENCVFNCVTESFMIRLHEKMDKESTASAVDMEIVSSYYMTTATVSFDDL